MTKWMMVTVVTLSLVLSLVSPVAAGPNDTLRWSVLIDSGHDGHASPGQRSKDLTDRTALALSGLAYDHQGATYWSIGDSGTNSFDWMIYLYKIKVSANRAQVMEKIPVRDRSGRHLSGAEIDPEDLALAPDGSFWAVDEHGPWILHIAADGTLLQKVEPPAKYKARKKGQGFEGGTLSPDGRTFYVMLQSGLTTQEDITLTWILAYDTLTGHFTEWSYQLERPSDYNYPAGAKVRMGSSGIYALGHGELLVLERDNLAAPNSRVKQVYRASLPTGGGHASKSLQVDLIALGYPYEKAEGITVPQPNTIVIINDNDGDASNPTALWFLHENL